MPLFLRQKLPLAQRWGQILTLMVAVLVCKAVITDRGALGCKPCSIDDCKNETNCLLGSSVDVCNCCTKCFRVSGECNQINSFYRDFTMFCAQLQFYGIPLLLNRPTKLNNWLNFMHMSQSEKRAKPKLIDLVVRIFPCSSSAAVFS